MRINETSVIDNELWTRVLEYDLDDPVSAYGFSTRLASENNWTKNFSKKAIVEYKKFMYLAGTSDLMVAPSEIVDTVWHQHLVYTQSYAAFCKIIGKDIQHIPSTHNSADALKFKQAKVRTTNLYISIFGTQPEEIWNYVNIFDSLELPKAKLKIRMGILLGVIMFMVLVLPLFHLIKPLYTHINNPYFLEGYILICVLSFIILEQVNKIRLQRILISFKPFTLLYDLHPSELVYLKTQSLSNVIHDQVNQMIVENKVVVKERTLEWRQPFRPETAEEAAVADLLTNRSWVYYSELLKSMKSKPVFLNVAASMDAFRKYLLKSKGFSRLFYINFGTFSLLLMAGFIRYLTGISRDKPVLLIGVTLIIFVLIICFYLQRLTSLFFTEIIPHFYKKEIIKAHHYKDSAWEYFLYGAAILTPVFAPLVIPPSEQSNDTSADSSCSSGGSGCGSSCGSSCGGCGGGD